MNILEGFSKDDDLIEFICTKCNYTLWVPHFIVQQLEEDNMFNGLDKSVPPQPFCQKMRWHYDTCFIHRHYWCLMSI